MPETLIHIVLPLFVLILAGFELKKAFALSLLAILPDFDILFGVHRSISHSLIFITLIFVPLLFLARKNKINYILPAFFVILSHPILDMFTGYTPILYPLYGKSVYIVANLTVNTVNLMDIRFRFKIYEIPTTFHLIETDAPIFTNYGIAVSLALLTALFINHLKGSR